MFIHQGGLQGITVPVTALIRTQDVEMNTKLTPSPMPQTKYTPNALHKRLQTLGERCSRTIDEIGISLRYSVCATVESMLAPLAVRSSSLRAGKIATGGALSSSSMDGEWQDGTSLEVPMETRAMACLGPPGNVSTVRGGDEGSYAGIWCVHGGPPHSLYAWDRLDFRITGGPWSLVISSIRCGLMASFEDGPC